MRILRAEAGHVIALGIQGENRAEAVEFDLSEFLELFGCGSAELFVRRPGEEAPYPVVLEQDDGMARWIVSDSDTALSGYGACELSWIVGAVVAKTVVFETFVISALTDPQPTPPEPAEDWVREVIEAKEQAIGAADRAEAAAVHPPMIGTDLHWWIWDPAQGEYVDTGIGAKGEDGKGLFQVKYGETTFDEIYAAYLGGLLPVVQSPSRGFCVLSEIIRSLSSEAHFFAPLIPRQPRAEMVMEHVMLKDGVWSYENLRLPCLTDWAEKQDRIDALGVLTGLGGGKVGTKDVDTSAQVDGQNLATSGAVAAASDVPLVVVAPHVQDGAEVPGTYDAEVPSWLLVSGETTKLRNGALLSLSFTADFVAPGKVFLNGQTSSPYYLRHPNESSSLRVQTPMSGAFKAGAPRLFKVANMGGANKYLVSCEQINRYELVGSVTAAASVGEIDLSQDGNLNKYRLRAVIVSIDLPSRSGEYGTVVFYGNSGSTAVYGVPLSGGTASNVRVCLDLTNGAGVPTAAWGGDAAFSLVGVASGKLLISDSITKISLLGQILSGTKITVYGVK